MEIQPMFPTLTEEPCDACIDKLGMFLTTNKSVGLILFRLIYLTFTSTEGITSIL